MKNTIILSNIFDIVIFVCLIIFIYYITTNIKKKHPKTMIDFHLLDRLLDRLNSFIMNNQKRNPHKLYLFHKHIYRQRAYV